MGMLLSRYHADSRNSNINNTAKGVTKEVAPKQPEKKKAIITEQEIKSMNGAKARKFAREHGIPNPEELTVGELKAILIEQFS